MIQIGGVRPAVGGEQHRHPPGGRELVADNHDHDCEGRGEERPGNSEDRAPEGERKQHDDRVNMKTAALHPRLNHVTDGEVDELKEHEKEDRPRPGHSDRRGRKAGGRRTPIAAPMAGM